MFFSEWMDKFEKQKHVLRLFVKSWHPGSTEYELAGGGGLPITAPSAESACGIIRSRIRKEGHNVMKEFDRALENRDYPELYSLLQSAWFGVPESTDCWSLPGFREAVGLLEDGPSDPLDEKGGE